MVMTTAEHPAEERTLPHLDPLLATPACEEPIRAELYGLEHLEAHARGLAHACAPGGRGTPGDPLLRRFRDNGRALTRAHAAIVAAARQESLGADAEWLL